MLAVLFFLPLVATQVIQVSVQSSSGDTNLAAFTAQSLDNVSILAEISAFCTSVRGSKECVNSLNNEIMSMRSQAGIWTYPQLVNNHFTHQLVLVECQMWSTRGYASEQECSLITDNAIRSVKVANAFPISDKLVEIVSGNELVSLQPDWQESIEGNTFYYFRKIAYLQSLADDYRVERITEIGFNLGHSTINWLLANPIASVLAFDVTRRLYTAAAINAVNTLFPNRTVNLITGDSTVSVPNYVRLMSGHSSGPKFNLLFIDGGHTYDVALADIVNMRALANQTFHILLVDDGNSQEVRSAWDYAEHTLRIVRLIKVQKVAWDDCINVNRVASGILAGSFESLPCTAEGGVPIGGDDNRGETSDMPADDVIVGEYIW